MNPIQLNEILQAVNGECRLSDVDDTMIFDISTDTRTLSPGSLFVALKGENFDGHRFIAAAYEKGCSACIAERNSEYAQDDYKNLILVDSTEQAFLQLGRYFRNRSNCKVVGVTGSVGKTTTKEMIWAVLNQQFSTLKTQGNFNNRVGLPKTLFELTPQHQAAVIEMGMSERGEISDLTRAALPDIGVITNIGVSHLENLGTRENILAAKLEILDGMRSDAPLILNVDNDLLQTVRLPNRRIIRCGIDSPDADVRAEELQERENATSFVICNKMAGAEHRLEAEIPCIGRHNVGNALIAYAAGMLLGMSDEAILEGLKQYQPSGMRQKTVRIHDILVIEDCYNASPDSMRAALQTLSDLKAQRKCAVLGDMLELGEISEQAHEDVGRLCAEKEIDLLVCFGELAKLYEKGYRLAGGKDAICFDDHDRAAAFLADWMKAGDAAWFKASRGMQLEKILQRFYQLKDTK